jgi:hypothetical protein
MYLVSYYKKKLFSFTTIVLFALIFLFSNELHAKPKYKVILEGDEVTYDLVSGNVNANGNVKINFRGYDIYSDKVLFSVPKGLLKFPNEFNMVKASQNIKAKEFSYDFRAYDGRSSNLDAKISRLKIKGKEILFESDKAVINDVSFTTCEEEDPHYRVEAKKMFLYPQWGFFVSWDNVFNFSLLPIKPWIPTYIYGSRTYSLVGSSTPIPEIGGNKREGGYVKQRYGYYLNENSTGTLDFGYTQNLGVFLGFNHGFGLSEGNKLNIRTHYLERDDYEGAIEYQLDIGSRDNVVAEDDYVGSFFSGFTQKKLPSGRLTVLMQHREIIADSRVSFRPEIKFDVNEYNILDSGVLFTSSVGYARVEEETIEEEFNKANEKSLSGGLRKRLSFGDKWLDMEFFGIGDWYNTGEIWRRSFAKTKIGWDASFLKPIVSYTKKLSNTGETPFEYKRMYALSEDEVGLSLTQDLGWCEVGLLMDYMLMQKSFRNLDIITKINFHCWKAVVTYLVKQKEFTLGVEIY